MAKNKTTRIATFSGFADGDAAGGAHFDIVLESGVFMGRRGYHAHWSRRTGALLNREATQDEKFFTELESEDAIRCFKDFVARAL